MFFFSSKEQGLSSRWSAWASLWSTGSGVCRLQLLQLVSSGVWYRGLAALRHVGFPRLGVEPVSSTLAGRFLTTGPSVKSLDFFFFFTFVLKSFGFFVLGFFFFLT